MPSVSAMEPTIEVAGLRKRYGATVAVDDLTFTVRPGEVTGFVGPNGAGKSTTMRIVLGLDAADAGTARIGGQPYRSLTAPLTEVGALLDAGAIHPGRRAGPPAVDGPEQRPSRPPRRRGARPGRARRRLPEGGPAGSRSACHSGSASPRRCWAIRRC